MLAKGSAVSFVKLSLVLVSLVLGLLLFTKGSFAAEDYSFSLSDFDQDPDESFSLDFTHALDLEDSSSDNSKTLDALPDDFWSFDDKKEGSQSDSEQDGQHDSQNVGATQKDQNTENEPSDLNNSVDEDALELWISGKKDSANAEWWTFDHGNKDSQDSNQGQTESGRSTSNGDSENSQEEQPSTNQANINNEHEENSEEVSKGLDGETDSSQEKEDKQDTTDNANTLTTDQANEGDNDHTSEENTSNGNSPQSHGYMDREFQTVSQSSIHSPLPKTISNKRDVRLEQNDQLLKLMSRAANADGDKSAFRVVLNAAETGAISAFDFFQKGQEHDRSGYRFRVNLYKIVEWEPSSKDEIYDPRNCKPVSVYNIGKRGWKKFDGKTFKISSKTIDGTKVFTFEATTADGVFTIRGHAAGKPVTHGKLKLDPKGVKFDYIINNYPYKGEAGKTSLALKAKVLTRTLPGSNFDDGKGGVIYVHDKDQKTSMETSFFVWDSAVTVNGKVHKVIPSALKKESHADDTEQKEQERKIYFNIQTTNHGSNIVWDPSMGVGERHGLYSAGAIPRVPMMIVTFIIAALLILM